MAHFAKLGLNNIVLEVVVVDTIDTMTPQGEEVEEVGIIFLKKLTGHEVWVQTSYNGKMRGLFAAPGMTYNSEIDEFIWAEGNIEWQE